jgi:hypothetical protein
MAKSFAIPPKVFAHAGKPFRAEESLKLSGVIQQHMESLGEIGVGIERVVFDDRQAKPGKGGVLAPPWLVGVLRSMAGLMDQPPGLLFGFEKPRATQATPPNQHPMNAAFENARDDRTHGLHITVPQQQRLCSGDQTDGLRDRLPIRLASIHLLQRPSMDRNRVRSILQ